MQHQQYAQARLSQPALLILASLAQGPRHVIAVQEAIEQTEGLYIRLVMWMLRLYPSAWRERYEAEMVALLEQHEITFWTVLDLLVGALDARLDPHYRRTLQLLPMQRLQASWKLLASAGIAFWLSLFLWAKMWDTVRYPDPLASSIAIVSIFFAILPFLLVVIVWIVVQAILRKRGWKLLRLLPVALLIFFFSCSHFKMDGSMTCFWPYSLLLWLWWRKVVEPCLSLQGVGKHDRARCSRRSSGCSRCSVSHRQITRTTSLMRKRETADRSWRYISSASPSR
jgi:hypothetical protein